MERRRKSSGKHKAEREGEGGIRGETRGRNKRHQKWRRGGEDRGEEGGV